MRSRAFSKAESLTAKRSGFAPIDWQIQKVVLLTAPIAFSLVVLGTLGGWQTDTLLKVSLAVSVIIGGDLLLLEAGSYPRSVTVTGEGIRFRFRLHSTRTTWDRVDPAIKKARGVSAGDGWFLRYPLFRKDPLPARGAPQVRMRAILLSNAQVLAILRFPSGKSWTPSTDLDSLLRQGTQ